MFIAPLQKAQFALSKRSVKLKICYFFVRLSFSKRVSPRLIRETMQIGEVRNIRIRHSPARPLPHLALGGVHVAVGAADRTVPRPRPLGAALGALGLVGGGELLGAGAVVGEGYSVPGGRNDGIFI